MTLRELYDLNDRWNKETELRLKVWGRKAIDIKAGEALKQYGDYYVCGFLNDVVEVGRKRTEVWTGGVVCDIQGITLN